jgi:hypothetical protein
LQELLADSVAREGNEELDKIGSKENSGGQRVEVTLM